MNNYYRLEEIFEQFYLLKRNLSLMNWDCAVVMPSGAIDIRGKMLAAQTLVMKNIIINDQTKKLIDDLIDNPNNLNEQQRANVRNMQVAYNMSLCIPDESQSQLTICAAQTEVLWRKAREQDNFQLVVHELTKLIGLIKEKAKYMGAAFTTDPYTGLMQEYDYGCNDSDVSAVFKRIESELPKTLAKIRKKPTNTTDLNLTLDIAQQKRLCHEVAIDLGFDFKHGRLDESEHPFTEGGKYDNRITVHYSKSKPLDSLFALVHEFGHSLYDSKLPDDYFMQPVGGDMGMMFHEATALFYEMYVGRSKFFAKYIYDKINNLYPGNALSLNQLETEFLCVKNSKIRIQSNQVEYLLHIILRYNLEKMLLLGDLQVKDLPDAWNAMFYKLFSQKIESNKEGCLQDIHWYLGQFGYFPCYGMGSVLASNIFKTQNIANFMQDTANSIPAFTRAIKKINDLMTKQLFAQGRFLDHQNLIEKLIHQKSLNVDTFLDYLNHKYAN